MAPRATYRLQFHKGFTFADAERLVPYFARLGISHVYASPITTARPGSMHGYDVIEVDHGWCTSIYAVDPNGTLVEFCATTKAFTDADREDAQRMLTEANPPLNEAPAPTFHQAQKTVAAT